MSRVATLILEYLRLLNHKVGIVMTQLDDVNASIAQANNDFVDFVTDLNGKIDALKTTVAALQAAVTAGNTGPDLGPTNAAINMLDQSIKAAKTAIDAASA